MEQKTVRAQIEGYIILPYDQQEYGTAVRLGCYTEFLGVTITKNDPYEWAKAWLMIYPDIDPLYPIGEPVPGEGPVPFAHKFIWIPEAQRIQLPDPREYLAIDAIRGGGFPDRRYLASKRNKGIYYHLYYLGYR
jgi:hypothetical protein